MSEPSAKIIPFKKVVTSNKEEKEESRPLSLREQRDMIVTKIESRRQYRPRRK